MATPQRIVLGRTRMEWWDHAGEFAAYPGKLVIVGSSRVIAVDPAMSSPNVTVGITLEEGQNPIFLRPGESITFPRDVRAVYVFNPLIRQLNLDLIAPQSTSRPLGLVSLLTGGVSDLIAWKSRANRTRPLPVASLLSTCDIGDGTVDPRIGAGVTTGNAALVPVHGLEAIRIKILPRHFQGELMEGATYPADLLGNLRLWAVRIIPWTPGAFNIGMVGRIDAESGQIAGDAARLLNLAATADFAFSSTETVIEYPVGAGDLLALLPTALAGVDIGTVCVIVEGV